MHDCTCSNVGTHNMHALIGTASAASLSADANTKKKRTHTTRPTNSSHYSADVTLDMLTL